MEAKKDKILSKRGDSYKLVLTKEYKHKASIYVFNYKISLKDEKQETFTNAFDHMVDYSIKDYPNGRIKIVPIHEIIITKHKSWPIRTYNTVKKLFMDQMERLLNSAEELNLEEVIFEVTIIPNKRGKGKALKILDVINKRSIIQIKNDDTICLSRAIVTSLASNKLLENFTNSQLKHIKEGRPLQKRVAEDLHEQSGVEIKEEANQETGIHIMNFCIAYDLENIYCFKNNYVKVFKCDFNIDDLNLLELDIDDCFSDVEKIPFREYETPIGNSVIDNFCKYFIRDKFKDYTFISHYGKGYDMQPILGWIIKNKIEHSIISSGLKLTFIFIKGINLRFIDSINFTLCGLAAFPKTFGFVGNKGYFPHYFNTTENQKYKGIYPDKEYFGYNTMTIKNKELFDEWYNKVKEKEFKFYKEIFYYCLLDVLILAKGCTLYRKLFLNITNNCIDPFQYITIAQCCTKIFKTLMLTNETIGIHKKMTIKEVHSQKSIQWLEYISLEYNIMIQHAKRGGEKKLFINNKCYKVDGYYYDRENKMRNVYEFFGCYWHGCTKCYSPEEICKKDRNKKTMKELYDQTKERLKTIEDYLKPNVKIHTIWECEFDQQKYPEVDPHLKPIDKRDAFYGGRTETIQLYNNLSDLKGRYVDFCSLYPSVNKYCKYPIGHPITYTDISVDDYIKNPHRNYFGIMKCKILPPKGLYHPVLPYKQFN
ncbi:Hypothetical predicted protein [Mytilus galloprovincialis]|uniref:DNA-directed DNA polymerase n=1 Tax=Mytilus galloprovincialis TaxID=29158 RepID=A0A8B6FJS2_MYTGA|nr:Hypothetical predicted protein [Mytilus galloprovincialis]